VTNIIDCNIFCSVLAYSCASSVNDVTSD